MAQRTRPFLGSTKQAYSIAGCLARDAGALIDIEKRLVIYDPAWMTTIEQSDGIGCRPRGN